MSKEEWLYDFITNLRSLMEKKHMSQVELSKKSKLTRQTINNYINGKQYPSAIAIVNLAYALGCDISDLIWTFDLVE